MKNIIKFALFSVFVAGVVILASTSGLSQKTNGVTLAGICKMTLASAEEDGCYETVKCGDVTKTNDDGTTETIHRVICYGDGALKCECGC